MSPEAADLLSKKSLVYSNNYSTNYERCQPRKQEARQDKNIGTNFEYLLCIHGDLIEYFFIKSELCFLFFLPVFPQLIHSRSINDTTDPYDFGSI